MEGADAKPIFHKGSELSIAAVLQIRKFVQSFQDMKGKKTDLPFFAGCSVQTADGTGSEVAGIPVRPAVTADQCVFQTFKAAFVDKSFSGDFYLFSSFILSVNLWIVCAALLSKTKKGRR